MKAAVLKSTNNIVFDEIETPEPGEGEVRIKVHYTGICGSDVPRALEGKVHNFPLVLGHEFSGRIDKVGPGVDEALVGQRVSGIPLIPCMECEDCSEGHYSLCKTYGFVGSRSDGSMAEYVVVPVSNAYPIGDDVTDLQGAFYEPTTVAIHGIELAEVKPGSSCIVVGSGTIGVLLAQALRGYGIGNIVVTKRVTTTFGPAQSVGIENIVASSEEGWQQKALDMAGVRGFDYVFDTAGNPSTILHSFEMAGNRGTVCFVGTPKRDVVFTSKQWELINRKELKLIGSWMSYSAPWPGVEWDRADELFANGTIKVTDEMIDSIYPMSKAQEAFQRFQASHGTHGKVIIDSQGV
ncbi:MAG: galactitol-1-phosphate 5-dehydrogenase [Coriobacteriales bacterium]|nr:galactitol-1-phosphate 5-dehydrogenase [Coriobacteriales bacterium]